MSGDHLDPRAGPAGQPPGASNVVDLGIERARRGLPIRHPLMQMLAPEPPPGLRRGDKVRLALTGEVGIVISHRWQAKDGRLALALTIRTPAQAWCLAADRVVPLLSTRAEPPHQPSPRV